jgi:hypothetical protein
MQKLLNILFHPALLFAAGNTALAVGHAEAIAITLNIVLTLVMLAARFVEVTKGKPFGIPFGILAVVNFITAGSVIYTNMLGDTAAQPLDYVAAVAYVAWGVGHLFAGRHERRRSTAKRVSENPQVFYGVGDMSAVNASGSLNPFSFPFMVVGFIKSVFIGKRIRTKRRLVRFLDGELTAARLYGLGFFVGALTSLAIPYFFIAQTFWGFAYFSFRKDT